MEKSLLSFHILHNSVDSIENLEMQIVAVLDIGHAVKNISNHSPQFFVIFRFLENL